MNIAIIIFKLLGGVGLFLFAMYLLEESLRNLSGRNFKIFLQRSTRNRLGAITAGALVTGVLQSSSMVSLIVLAFVGAGIFSMRNAIAIILGANLGTTLDSWLVATLGFKANLEITSYPAIFAGGFLLILFGKHRNLKYISWFLLGFGLLFIALSFMKMAMEDQVNTFDFSRYKDTSMAWFLLIGFVLTMLVQSSSVTMALTLSAVHAGAVTFPAAAAIVLGSETGTSIKLLLAAMGGNASKKRIALGNLLFNIFLTVSAFILLKPILSLITGTFNIGDPLIGLVSFSTLINLVSILIFLPFLDPFAAFLERLYTNTDTSAAAFIGHADVKEPHTALDLFRKEIAWFIYDSMLFNLLSFQLGEKALPRNAEFKKMNDKRKFLSLAQEERYEFLKQLQGELQEFYIRARARGEQIAVYTRLISAARSSMYAVKCVNNIASNISDLRRSSKDIKYDFFLQHKRKTEELYKQIHTLFSHGGKDDSQKLATIFQEIQENYSLALDKFYKDAQHSKIEHLDITSVLNLNRELFTSNKAMLMAIKDFLLEEKEAEEFNEIPVYKT